ncbi:AAA family ATPase [Paenibacillus rhizovicinus]|uniref:AAA family ATPase n=1 Tax=Paenibacillus rhizovicinus TaxID=2704463 RepID=A0A6C0P6W7_9BACL|nr:AAA family ATPase [Paenibacillus rhizovicinus]QHW34268.1 AAA family ATPase [Paenibacillus rhizovicinus]
MRLQKLHVEGFGKLSDVICSLDAPVTIAYGPNEAGKSTMQSFLRTMLFGFANKGSRTERLEPVNGGRHGGRLFFADEAGHSYVMERYGSSSSKVTVRRLAGEGADSDAAGGERGDTLTQPQWERLFLGGIGERVFRELFAITLTELQAIGMLEGDELGKQLYHAGWNGGSAIAGTEKLLQGQLDELFKPRGSNQQMSKLLKALDETEEQLRRLEDGISAFNALTTDIEETEGKLAAVEERLPRLRSQSALLERAAELRPAWMQRLTLLQELEALKDAPRLAADARSRWETLANELRRAREELHEANELSDRLDNRIEQLVCDAELLARRVDIDTLMRSVEQITAAKQSVTELDAETDEHREAVKRLLLRISPSWTEASLRGFLAGVAEREAVRVHRTTLQDTEKALHLAEAEHRAAHGREREAAASLAETESSDSYGSGRTVAGALGLSGAAGDEAEVDKAMGMAGVEAEDEAAAEIFRLLPQTEDALRYAARQFEEAWRELELAQLREQHEAEAAAEAGAGRRGGYGGAAIYGAAAVVLAAGAAALAAAGLAAAASAAGVGAAALAVPALLRLARARTPRGAGGAAGRGSRSGRAARRAEAPAAAGASAAAGHAAAAEQRVLAALGALVAAPSAALALLLPRQRAGGAAAAATLREAAAAREQQARSRPGTAPASPAQLLARLRAAIDARQDGLRAQASSAERHAEQKRAYARLRAQERSARAAADAAAQAYDIAAADWREWLTARKLPPALSPEAAMETIELAEQAQLRVLAQDRAAGKAARLRDGIAAFEQAAGALCEAFPGAAYLAHGDAVTALRLLQADAGKQASIQAEREELKLKQAEQAMREESLLRKLEELEKQRDRWFAAGKASDEPEWLNALQRSERLLDIEHDMYKLNAQLGAGMTDSDSAQLEEWYAGMDDAGLRGMLTDVQTSWKEAEKLRSELLELIGRRKQKLELLLKDGDRQRLIGEREQQSAALERLIDRYAVLSLSMTMIKRTKRIMEEQRQPGVLREASRLMSKLSEGRYTRISMPEGERTIALETQDGRIVESGFLSRGTAEQLYLAMRFALAGEAAAVHALPLLLDDPFVNFDYGRLQAAAGVLEELAEQRQIVFFTCHAHMKDLLLDRLKGARLIELAR